MDRTRNRLALGRRQLWLLPAVITAFAAAAALLLTADGIRVPGLDLIAGWLYRGSAATARELLSSLLTSLITMTSLVISVTFVILTLAASQLGPRLITIFMADVEIQFVLGLFLGTILYLVIVSSSLNEEGAAPRLAISLAIALTIACLLALLFYIHKIARSINADHVVEEVTRELQANVREMDRRHAAEVRPAGTSSLPVAETIAIEKAGYIQVVEYDQLVEIAARNRTVLEIPVRAGHFILQTGEHVVVRGHQPLPEEERENVRSAFTIGRERTAAQDLEHGLRRLVEIAVRALSPGINDPYTAMSVLDHLGMAFEQIFRHPLQPEALHDDNGALRVIAKRSAPSGLIDAAFDPIRQAGAEHPAVVIRMADTIGKMAPSLDTREKRDAALRQLTKLEESVRAAALAASDERDSLHRISSARSALSRQTQAV